MTERDFAYWLRGFFEISNADGLSETEVQIIKDHLALVFRKETPDRSPSFSGQAHQYPLWNPSEIVC